VKNVQIPYSNNKVVEDSELGIQKPLINWEQYENRRYKYQDNSNTGKHGLLKNKYWMPKDFKM
jgi:uncharacterized membrane protein YfhO